MVESKQERDSVLSLKEIEIKEAVEAKEALLRTKDELILLVSSAEENALLDKCKAAELSLEKLTK